MKQFKHFMNLLLQSLKILILSYFFINSIVLIQIDKYNNKHTFQELTSCVKYLQEMGQKILLIIQQSSKNSFKY